jgi:putative DNA primase/helicase
MVDIDTDDDAEVAAITSVLPTSPWSRVGRKGKALAFRNPHNVCNFSVPGLVDFLAAGRQVILPPTIHPETGLPYTASCPLYERATLDALPILPKDFKARLHQALQRSNPTSSVEEGGRHLRLASEVGRLRNRGFTGEKLAAALHAFNSEFCKPPLPAEEVNSLASWGVGIDGSDHHPLTELGNGRRLVERLAGNALFVTEGAEWRVWDGTRWGPDSDGFVEREAKAVADALYSGSVGNKERYSAARNAQSARGIRAMMQLARTEPFVLASAAQFDTTVDVINTPSGIVDLKTGELRPAARDEFHSMATAVGYDPGAPCPRFEEFVSQIFPDPAIAQCVQRVVGYCLTGQTKEQKLIIATGAGANGKSVFYNRIVECLGDYAKRTPMSTFMQRRSGAATNDLATLMGVRLVVANEGNPGEVLDTALVKGMTGGDPITARMLFKEFVTYVPRFKPLIVSNHLPEIDGNDPAIWRRVLIIPFSRVFADAEQDTGLPAILQSELPGILRWAVEGAVAYYKEGLNPPDALLRAAMAYRSEMDIVGSFIADRCTVSAGVECPATPLYRDYGAYARHAGTEVMSQTAFGRELARRGFGTCKRDGAVWRRGLTLRPIPLELAA